MTLRQFADSTVRTYLRVQGTRLSPDAMAVLPNVPRTAAASLGVMGCENPLDANAGAFVAGESGSGEQCLFHDGGVPRIAGRLLSIMGRAGQDLSRCAVKTTPADRPKTVPLAACGDRHATLGDVPVAPNSGASSDRAMCTER
jgi:hypothetical protein